MDGGLLLHETEVRERGNVEQLARGNSRVRAATWLVTESESLPVLHPAGRGTSYSAAQTQHCPAPSLHCPCLLLLLLTVVCLPSLTPSPAPPYPHPPPPPFFHLPPVRWPSAGLRAATSATQRGRPADAQQSGGCQGAAWAGERNDPGSYGGQGAAEIRLRNDCNGECWRGSTATNEN